MGAQQASPLLAVAITELYLKRGEPGEKPVDGN
jgi:hypothetical protein